MEKLKNILGFIVVLFTTYLGYQEVHELFIDFAALIAGIFTITELFKANVKNSTWVQIFSWSIGTILSLVAYLLELGMFADYSLLFSIFTGLGTALITNGIADAQFVQMFLQFIRNQLK